MKKMDADYISRHEIAKRYLQGKLTTEESVEFEEYILDKPELLEQLELDSVMVDSLPKVYPTSVEVASKPLFKFMLNWKKTFATTSILSCCLLLVMTIKLSVYSGGNLTSQTSPDLIFFEVVRGNADEAVVQYNGSQTSKIFVIDVGGESLAHYDILLEEKDTGQKWEWAEQTANNNGELVITLAHRLPSGEYALSLRTDGDKKNQYYQYFELKVLP